MNTGIVTRLLLLIAILAGTSEVWAADMNAWLDRTQIAAGETVQLTLEVKGNVSGRPNTAPLEKDFEILGLSTGSRVNIINGNTDARTTWTLTLSPRHSGTLTIPPMQVGGHQSDTLKLEVSQTPVQTSDSGADIMIETTVEPGDPYVQGKILYTMRLLYAVPISNGHLNAPEPDNILVQLLGKDRKYTTTRNGRRYQVIERHYAMFPQTSGPLELPAAVFDGEIPDTSRRRTSPFKQLFGNDPFFSHDPFEGLTTPTRRVQVRGEKKKLDIKPRPVTAHGNHWLPAKHLELKGEWQPQSTSVQVGSPITLILDLKAEGLTAGQLPDLAPGAVAGFKVFPDQAQRHTETTDTDVTGHLQQKIAFLPQRAGELELPTIELHWWNTQQNQEHIATLPSRTIEVSPAPNQPAQTNADQTPPTETHEQAPVQTPPRNPTQVPQQPQTQPNTMLQSIPLWIWISLALATGWLCTILLWWWHTRRKPSTVESEPFKEKSDGATKKRKQFLAACRDGDAATARASLLAWAAAHWPDNPPRGLEEIARRIQDAKTHEAIAELNRALYKDGGLWNGERLASLLQQLPASDYKAVTNKTVLAPLYPERRDNA